MTTTTLTTPLAAPARIRVGRIFGLEVRNELLKLLRTPAFAIPALCFPWIFYVFFGLVLPTPKVGGTTMATYLLGTYGVFGVLGVSLFALGTGVAMERARGWTTARRAMAASPVIEVAARLAVAAVVGAIVALGLLVLGATVGGVVMPTAAWASLLAIFIACALPFGAIGLALGQALSAEAAPAVINVVYLPLSFLSGLWLPVAALPAPVRAVAEWLPPYHASQLALDVLGAARYNSPWPSVANLVVTTAVAFAVATWVTRRQAGGR
jgi:ABC-2 type transport system permease protein